MVVLILVPKSALYMFESLLIDDVIDCFKYNNFEVPLLFSTAATAATTCSLCVLFSLRPHLPPSTLLLLPFAASPDKEIAAEKVLKEFHATIENAAASSVKGYAAYIDKMCKIGNLSAVSQMLQALQDRNISVPPNVYIVFLAEASQKSDIDLSCQAFKKLLLSSKSPSAASCLSFAQAFTKANGCIELLRFIEEVSEITCSSTSFVNKIIFALAKSGQKDKALVIFDYLKSRNYSLDLVTYNIVLDILGRTGRVDEMLDVFATMKEAGFVPDIVSYNTVLNGLRKAGRTDMCIVYFKEMSENGIEPDLLTYTALIESFGRSGNAEESLKCFREMKLKGILPSIYIYRSLINNLNKSGKVELAKELLEEMNSSSTRLAGPEDFKHKRRRRNKLTEGPEVR
ncbi:pentatricopeptide repeat-containing protein At1g11900-like isoform X1 [Arachis stenosperma]|uniref:pentatricopeptide repeat-containing protein At1g11900-like isoform X1 n=1 Tax=Arachis stenosperma TaxID=217475 RepID=UPI0025AD61B0|nr:pentatricopeptide repeat-containing protein At1g11900-like isoform X1 [Arachis stenosperma]XP_057763449.1 pentatricopeptide repeat-containing protein At1g11900-like isoform X1 [Arachis stenosperma]